MRRTLQHAAIYPAAGKTPQVPYRSPSSDKDFCFNPLLTPEMQLEARWFGAEHAAWLQQVEVKLLRAEPAPGPVAGLGAAVCPLPAPWHFWAGAARTPTASPWLRPPCSLS